MSSAKALLEMHCLPTFNAQNDGLDKLSRPGNYLGTGRNQSQGHI
jgi:hypothetical protein